MPRLRYMNTDAGATLLAIARAEIAGALGQCLSVDTSSPWLAQPGATFVTLTLNGKLRGCIGSLEAHRSVLQDVRANALAAALHDPRFAPVTRDELDALRVEVSLLAPAEALIFADEQDALAQLRPHIDGVIFAYGAHRSTFLPQVWAQLPDAKTFMAHLKHKAGLAPDFWDAGVRLSRYSVRKWSEREEKSH